MLSVCRNMWFDILSYHRFTPLFLQPQLLLVATAILGPSEIEINLCFFNHEWKWPWRVKWPCLTISYHLWFFFHTNMVGLTAGLTKKNMTQGTTKICQRRRDPRWSHCAWSDDSHLPPPPSTRNGLWSQLSSALVQASHGHQIWRNPFCSLLVFQKDVPHREKRQHIFKKYAVTNVGPVGSNMGEDCNSSHKLSWCVSKTTSHPRILQSQLARNFGGSTGPINIWANLSGSSNFVLLHLILLGGFNINDSTPRIELLRQTYGDDQDPTAPIDEVIHSGIVVTTYQGWHDRPGQKDAGNKWFWGRPWNMQAKNRTANRESWLQ